MQAFGDGFDLYATTNDLSVGYWDASTPWNFTLSTGRFTGSQAIRFTNNAPNLTKSSGQNDAVHHITLAHQTTNPISGTSVFPVIQLLDGTNYQCTIGFRSDGALLLMSGNTGSVLDTYTGAITATSTWYAFEIEVVINNTTGSWAVRKNGNTANDHVLGSLNTRAGSTNNYANKINIGNANSTANAFYFDDLLWRSDPTSVPWVGDIRCYTRMPASDVQAQFSRSSTSFTSTLVPNAGSSGSNAGTAIAVAFTAAHSGTLTSGTINLTAGVTGHIAVALYDNSSPNSNLIATATVMTNPTTGLNTFTFPTPPTLVSGTIYRLAVDQDVTINYFAQNTSAYTWTQTYGWFPANPAVMGNSSVIAPPNVTITITATNASLVSEAQQDGTTTYVYDSNVGDNDLYAIAASATPPQSTVCVTTRGFFEKSDAGTRNAAVQLKSGTTTVQSTSTALSTSWGWLYRTDLNDPNTSAAWTATAVNNAQIGPVVTA